MSYYGDIRLGDTIDIKFVTTAAATGAPTQLAGTPAISAYPGNSTTQLTAGITLSVDFDTVTGLNNVRVVATSGNGYATATNYDLVITTGTVGGTSAVGYVVGSFSIENRSALMPTTATRTLDVSATGEAGVDWANVGSPTTAVNLSATNIDVDQVVASVSGAVGSVTGAVGSVTGLTNATIADAVLDEDMTAHQTQGSLGQAIGDPGADTDTIWALVNTNLDAAVSSRLASAGYTAPLDAAGTRTAVGLASANLDTQLDALPTAAEIVAAQLTTQITEAYRANAAAPTLAQFMSEVLAHLGEAAISGTTKTINKLDHVTAAETFTLDDATTPSSITRAT